MIDGKTFILENYPAKNNPNDVEIYKSLYHPDALWCPPDYEDKRGVDQISFAFAFKNYKIQVEILEIESLDTETCSYVTGLVDVRTFHNDTALNKKLILRGSWLVVEYDGRLVIRYQVWNEKKRS